MIQSTIEMTDDLLSKLKLITLFIAADAAAAAVVVVVVDCRMCVCARLN